LCKINEEYLKKTCKMDDAIRMLKHRVFIIPIEYVNNDLFVDI